MFHVPCLLLCPLFFLSSHCFLASHLPCFRAFVAELSNTIWAFATAGVRGDTQVELVKFIADALDEGGGLFFGLRFKRT